MTIQTNRGTEIDTVMLGKYLHNLVNQFFKILPMREKQEASLCTYMVSLQAELLGCRNLVILIQDDPMYLTLLSILQYLIDNLEDDPKTFRREVFKAISICNKLNDRYAAPSEEAV